MHPNKFHGCKEENPHKMPIELAESLRIPSTILGKARLFREHHGWSGDSFIK
jgi:hypothetical protein